MNDIDIKIIRKNIKNIYLRVVNKNQITITAGYFVPTIYLKYFIKKRKKWIENKIQNIKKKEKNTSNILYFLDKKYKIKYIKSDIEKIILKQKTCYIYILNKKNNINIIEEFYTQKANKILPIIIKRYLKITNQEINTLRIKKMNTRWGSCNHKKRYINLNKYLVKENINFINYVILHEIAHLTHPNHSKDFYKYIEKFMPKYKEYI
jgi:predicted metal-dependent hydrolase